MVAAGMPSERLVMIELRRLAVGYEVIAPGLAQHAARRAADDVHWHGTNLPRMGNRRASLYAPPNSTSMLSRESCSVANCQGRTSQVKCALGTIKPGIELA